MFVIRTENNGIRYFSFQELPNAKKPKQKTEYSKKMKCKGCGQQMVLVEGTNVYVCPNPKCKGVPLKKKKDGKYATSYRLIGDEIIRKDKKEK